MKPENILQYLKLPFMYDHRHLCYLNYNQPKKFKLVNQDFYDGNPTSKHDFLNIQHLSNFL